MHVFTSSGRSPVTSNFYDFVRTPADRRRQGWGGHAQLACFPHWFRHTLYSLTVWCMSNCEVGLCLCFKDTKHSALFTSEAIPRLASDRFLRSPVLDKMNIVLAACRPPNFMLLALQEVGACDSCLALSMHYARTAIRYRMYSERCATTCLCAPVALPDDLS